jgi:hypothetical protein
MARQDQQLQSLDHFCSQELQELAQLNSSNRFGPIFCNTAEGYATPRIPPRRTQQLAQAVRIWVWAADCCDVRTVAGRLQADRKELLLLRLRWISWELRGFGIGARREKAGVFQLAIWEMRNGKRREIGVGRGRREGRRKTISGGVWPYLIILFIIN